MENRILGKSIAVLHRREQKYMTQTMKEYGIGYSSYNFLFYLSANPGSSQKEMCENMAVDEALAVRTMKKLQEQGFVERKKSEAHGRSYAIYLTEKGEETIHSRSMGGKLYSFFGIFWVSAISSATSFADAAVSFAVIFPVFASSGALDRKSTRLNSSHLA